METGIKKDRDQKVLIGLVSLLAVGLILETGYLVKVNKTAHSEEVPVGIRPGSLREPALDFKGWEPLADMEKMQRQMNRMFQQSFRQAIPFVRQYPQSMGSSFFEPDMDIQEQGDHYLITMDVPGMEKDQIKLDVRDGSLTVSGERNTEKQENEKDGYSYMERSAGSFFRQIPLPPDAKAEGVTAQYQKGVLSIEVPKAAEKISQKKEEPKPIPIQ